MNNKTFNKTNGYVKIYGFLISIEIKHQIIFLFSWVFFTCAMLNAFYYLYNYRVFMTIYKITNEFPFYHPLQMDDIFLWWFLGIIFAVFVISFFLMLNIYKIKSEEIYDSIFGDVKYHMSSLFVLNGLMFFIGRYVSMPFKSFYWAELFGFGVCPISLFLCLWISIKLKNKENAGLNLYNDLVLKNRTKKIKNNEVNNISLIRNKTFLISYFRSLTLSNILALNLYYFIYDICELIVYHSNTILTYKYTGLYGLIILNIVLISLIIKFSDFSMSFLSILFNMGHFFYFQILPPEIKKENLIDETEAYISASLIAVFGVLAVIYSKRYYRLYMQKDEFELLYGKEKNE